MDDQDRGTYYLEELQRATNTNACKFLQVVDLQADMRAIEAVAHLCALMFQAGLTLGLVDAGAQAIDQGHDLNLQIDPDLFVADAGPLSEGWAGWDD